MINLVSESVTHNYYAHAKEELLIKVNTRDSFSFLVDKIKKERRKKRKTQNTWPPDFLTVWKPAWQMLRSPSPRLKTSSKEEAWNMYY